MWFIKKKSNEQKTAEGKTGQTFLGFTRELVLTLAMALIVIQYVIQAFKIPTGSMEDSLLINDFLLGLKFIYGAPVLPFSYAKFPGFTSPKPNDVVIFKFPGPESKDYIKRCVAGPGQTVEIRDKELYVDNKRVPLPPDGKHVSSEIFKGSDPRDNFPPTRVPKKGDTLRLSDLTVRDFFFARSIIHQENPRANLRSDLQLYIDGTYRNQDYSLQHLFRPLRFADINFEKIEWGFMQEIVDQIKNSMPQSNIEIKKFLFMDEKPVREYILKYDCYFMMGDNRDNSKDSRYWGFLNKNFVKAKAFILYFSYDKYSSIFNPVQFIRWNRIGKLIK